MARTVTPRGLIVGVFRLLGITAQGEQPSADELLEAFDRLNELVDRWQTQRLTMRAITRSVHDLVADRATYSLGPDAVAPDFVMARPDSIAAVTLLLTSSTPNTELPLGCMTDATYQGLSQKALAGSQPTAYYFQATMPSASLTLWPVPDTADNDLVLYVPEILSQFAGLSTEYTLAPGYTSALRYNLAVELAREYGTAIDPDTRAMAAETLRNIKEQNVRLSDLGLDPGLLLPLGNRYGYNILTDTP